MKKKLSSILQPKNVLIALSVLCIAFIGSSFFTDKLTAPLRNAVSTVIIPLQKGMNYIGLWTSEKYNTLQEMKTVLEENQQLKQQVNDLTEENNKLKQDGYELDRLRGLYALDQQYQSYPKVGARVIGSTTDNWYSTFTIDKGSNDGIEVDMNVIADGGLVGIVTEVGSNYSIVKSIIEDNSYASCMLISTGDSCAAKGDLKLHDSGLLHLEYLKNGVEVRDGDKIVTSNISDKYLEGIVVGYAKDVKMDSNNLTQSGYIVPAVDFNHLQEVLVITQKKVVKQ